MKLRRFSSFILAVCLAGMCIPSAMADGTDVFTYLEQSLGDLTAVSGKINLESSINGQSVTWEIENTSVVDYDGNVSALPTYAEGPLETNITAKINGAEKTYKVRTATQPIPIFESWDAEDGSDGDTVDSFKNAVITNQEAKNGEKSYLATVDPTASYGWQYFFTHKFNLPAGITSDTKYIANMYVKELKDVKPTSNYANGILVGGSPYSFSVNKPPLSNTEWKQWSVVSVAAKNNIQPGFSGGAPEYVLVDDYEIAPLAVGSININGSSDVYIPLHGNDANTLELKYEILNQYGTNLGMVRWNTDPARSWDSQTATWSIINPQEGVSIDENGVLTVTSDAHRGTVTVRATVDKSDLPGSGWIYCEKTVNLGSTLDSVPILRNVSLSGTVEVGNTLSLSYDYYHIDGIEEDSVQIRWLRADKDEKALYVPIDGAVGKNYTVTEEDIGKCLKAELIPKDKNGVVGKAQYTDVIASKTAPAAHNVKINITGVITVGTALKGTFTYYDINNDDAGTHTFRWLRADNEKDEPEVIEGAIDSEYILAASDLGKYLYFEVTPVSVAEPFSGEPVRSRAMRIPATEVSINITNLIIDGIPAPGEELGGYYEYKNYSDIKEGKSICKWYAADTIDGEYEVFEAKYTSAEENSRITVPEDFIGKYVMFEIIPFDSEGNYGISVLSEPVEIISDTEEIKSSVSYIEEQMGNMNAIDKNSKFVNSTSEASVTWSSTDESVIDSDGTVNLAEYAEGVKNVTMIAEINVSGEKYYKVYRLQTSTLGPYIFAKFDAENASVGSTPTGLGRSVVTDSTSHLGEQSYLVTPSQSGNPRIGFSYNVNINNVSPAYTVTDSTRLLMNSYLKKIENSSQNATPTAIFGPSAPDNTSYTYTADLKWNSESWTQFQAMSHAKYRYQLQNYFYSSTFTESFYLDDFEISVLSVGSINVDGAETLEIPLFGESESSASYTYEMFNQYGTTMGMGEWNWTRNEKDYSVPGQTASWRLARDYEGVTLDENGILTVSDNAHAGEIKVRAYADPSDLPGSEWVYGEKTVTLVSKNTPVPEARNIKAEGVIEIGNTVTGSYDYYHADNACEGETEIKWLRADKNEESAFVPIDGGNSFEYEITDADLNKYLCFEVTPKDYKGNAGEKVRSNVIAVPMAPEARSIKITANGKIAVGTELVGTYTYYDINTADREAETEFRWLRADTEGGIYKAIEGAVSKKYTLTEADIDKYIKFEVTPVSDTEPQKGEAAKSEAMAGPARPKAENVTVNGTLKPGNTVSGSYTYTHIHSYPEENSTYEWYIGNTKVADTISYKITSSDAGKRLTFKVTPHTNAEPASGETYSSQTYTIRSATSDNIGISGGGGSGGGYTSSVSGSNSNSSGNTVGNTQGTAVTSSYFTDTKNHWAFSDIEMMAEKGIAKGVSANTFNPDGIITRAEFVTLVLRALELSETEYSEGFEDVNAEDWFAGYIETAAQNKIVSDTASKFYPNTPVTRQEMAKIVVEAYKTDGNETDLSKSPGFTDENAINAWAKGYVAAAEELGLIKGVGNNFFEPLRTATRAEAIVIIKRLYELMY